MKKEEKLDIEHLYSIEIPKFIQNVQTAQAKRPKYYSNQSGAGRTKKLPKRLVKQGYTIDIFGYYLDKNGERVISNPRSAGKPRFLPINNQYIYSQNGSHFSRKAIVDGLKGFFTPYIKTIPIFKKLPIIIDCDLYSTVDGKTSDGDNFGSIYGKVFSDCLVAEGKIPDDSFYFITKPGNSPLFHPVKTNGDRKLIYHFYHDKRKEVQQLPLIKLGLITPP